MHGYEIVGELPRGAILLVCYNSYSSLNANLNLKIEFLCQKSKRLQLESKFKLEN
jgi:hypothetical protein